jgi:hypothetical protein
MPRNYSKRNKEYLIFFGRKPDEHRINLKYQYKITAPQHTFQIDIFWWKQSEPLIPILLFVDGLSRKAWAYVLTKSKKKRERATVSVKIYNNLRMKLD